MIERKYRYLYLIGIISSIIAYSFHKYLWESSYYHFIALSYVFISAYVYKTAKNNKWKDISFVCQVACDNNLIDEILGNAGIFNWTEYISIVVIIVYLQIKNKYRWKF